MDELTNPSSRHFSPVYLETVQLLRNNGEKEWTTTEISEALKKSRPSVRSAMRLLFSEGLIEFKRAVRKEQHFVATNKLLEASDG